MNPTVRALGASLFLLASASAYPGGQGDLLAQQVARGIRADFRDGWTDRWTHVPLAARATRYTVVREDGDPVLEAKSDRSASGLWRKLDIRSGESGTVSWRWKIEHALAGNRREREKRGDDYAARFFVVFGSEPFARESQALCYVWAAEEPVGSVYVNPYLPGVITIVVESGDERAGEWVTEERDFVEDYREAFGEAPDPVSAVAVVVDTDNTGASATAWFDDIDFKLH